MADERTVGWWCVTEEDLQDLDAVKARDLVIRCFFEAHKETYAAAKAKLGVPTGDDEVRRSIVAAVRLAFREVGADFDHPTKEALTQVIDVLGRKAAAWGTPKEVVEHHKGEIRKVLARLER